MLPRLRRREQSNLIVRGVLFDFDGTLTRPGLIDFRAIRAEIGCPADLSILDHIASLKESKQQSLAQTILEGHEGRAADKSVPNDGAEDLVCSLIEDGVPVAIQTRNTLDSVRRGFRGFRRIRQKDFALIIARDSDVEPKPSAEGIYRAADRMNLPPETLLVVGDYRYELEAADSAGCLSAFLYTEATTADDDESRAIRAVCENLASYALETLGDVAAVIRLHRPLPQGKLPNDLLHAFIADNPSSADDSVLIGPRPGEDVAVVQPVDGDVIVVKSDPVTFSTERPAYSTVVVNANDIATSGATPRWMTTSTLFPAGTPAAAIRLQFAELAAEARDAGISVIGGHTEITDAVARPVIAATVLGTLPPDRILDPASAESGDIIIMTKTAGVEGTSILAWESADRIEASGVDRDVIDEAASLANSLSIVAEARIAAETPGVRCIHDVTEGGVATAVEELSWCTSRSVTAAVDRIPIHPATSAVCQALSVDPLGLIGSGSALICVDADAAETLMTRLSEAGIAASAIGSLGEPVSSATEELPVVYGRCGGQPVSWPRFATDELARYFGN